MSRYLTDYLPAEDKPIEIVVNTAGHFEQPEIEGSIIKNMGTNPKRKVVNILTEFVPKRLSAVVCELAGCDGGLPAGQLKKDIRKKLIKLVKALPLSIVRTKPIAEATVPRTSERT